MIVRRDLLAGAGALALASRVPSALADAPAKDDGRMVTIPGGYKVWTQAVGPKPNILLLHGGPGFSHDYLQCFADFLPKAGLGFYFYDQLGCGRSDHPNDDKLWTVARYTDEVEAVRKDLGLENFILYGHSWGGMLGIEYALKYGHNLSKLVISDMTASVPAYVEHAKVMRAALSKEDQATLDKYEAMNKTDDPHYQAVIDKLDAQHVLRLKQPWPAPVMNAFNHANLHIYNVMQGPNEFSITGNFKDWDRWADLPKIKTKTLVMGAKYDEMDPEQMRREGKLIPGAQTWISERGSHLCMWDDQQAYFEALTGFLKA